MIAFEHSASLGWCKGLDTDYLFFSFYYILNSGFEHCAVQSSGMVYKTKTITLDSLVSNKQTCAFILFSKNSTQFAVISNCLFINFQTFTKFEHRKKWQFPLKFRFSEKATIFKNLPLVLPLLSKHQNKWEIFFQISGPSHNILTLT